MNKFSADPAGQLSVRSRRNKGYEVTHEAIIEGAVQLISQQGADAVTMAAVARETGVDRKTLYYHFRDREALLASAKGWSAERLSRGMDADEPRAARTAHISRFVLENPELIKLWFEDFIAPGDIRTRYPRWDELVAGMRGNLAHHDGVIDVDVYCTIMLTAAFIAPRVFQNSVRPDLDIEQIVKLFAKEQARVLAVDAQLSDDADD